MWMLMLIDDVDVEGGTGGTTIVPHSPWYRGTKCSCSTYWAIPPVRLGLSRRNSGKILERPRKRSQSVSWNFPREYGWDAPNLIIQGIWAFQSISRILPPPPSPLRAPLFFFLELAPKRASQSRSWNFQQHWGYFWPTGPTPLHWLTRINSVIRYHRINSRSKSLPI